MKSVKSFIELNFISRLSPTKNVPSNLGAQNLEPQSVDGGRKKWAVLEVVCLTIVIVAVIGLCSLPAVFFYLPKSMSNLINENCAKGEELERLLLTNTSDNASLQEFFPLQSCSEGFYHDSKTGGCSPKCPEWRLFSKEASLALDYILLILVPFGILAGITLLVVSCIRRRKVCEFPSILVVYHTIAILVLISFELISFFERSKLHCTSPNLAESINTSTSFCVLIGVITHYVTLQTNIWWVLHVVMVCWKVFFPIRARHFQSTNRMKMVHAVCVILSLLIPLIPAVMPFIDNAVREAQAKEPIPKTYGYGTFTFPAILCAGLDQNITFYTIVLPNIILLTMGIIALILTIWKIHKVQGLFHSDSKAPFHVSIAEKKLFIIVCYYIVSQVIGFSSFTLYSRASETLKQEIRCYFYCEGSGLLNDCDKSRLENIVNPGMIILGYIMGAVAPAINFVFVVDCRELKQKIKAVGTTSTITT